MLTLLIPEYTGIYRIAADAFAELWQKITAEVPAIVTEAPASGDVVVFGSDTVNRFTHAKIIDKTIEDLPLRTDCDDYVIQSAVENNRQLLFLAGGRKRALLYAVYHFFELRGGCRYFWDGDVIPKKAAIDISGLKVAESPRFEFRGLRYFAHRSLDRFQAEHWNLEQWQHEIDWIVKKRMNLFMLRIGIDDIFQKAFPEIVDYPTWKVPEAVPRSYDDRNLFWSLQVRGELRRQLLRYARDRDLMHPEDVGTMTHWYSRTPQQYLDAVKPDFVPQASGCYGEKTGLVWDIRQDRNLDAYFKLTETHIREYGSPQLFHTIGLAERRCYKDDAANHEMKLYTYRRIIRKLREHYPQAPLLVASWDFPVYWTPEQVRELVAQLNPANTLILDYTNDSDSEINCFRNWGLVGKFPWVFGIFHAYESQSDMRGNYPVIERNLPLAVADEQCKGLIYWPEISHSDTLMLEYFAANTWSPTNDNISIRHFVRRFCQERYDEKTAAAMLPIWEASLPLAESQHWTGPSTPSYLTHNYPLYTMRVNQWADWSRAGLMRMDHFTRQMKMPLAGCQPMLKALAAVELRTASEFVVRDVIDLLRMVVARACEYACMSAKLAMEDWYQRTVEPDTVLSWLRQARRLQMRMLEILSASHEFSLYDSLQALQAKHETNPDFEVTLKGNAENDYCRAQMTELVSDVYLPVMDAFIDYVSKRLTAAERMPWKDLREPLKTISKAVVDRFYAKPLADMQVNSPAALEALPQTIIALAEDVDNMFSRS